MTQKISRTKPAAPRKRKPGAGAPQKNHTRGPVIPRTVALHQDQWDYIDSLAPGNTSEVLRTLIDQLIA